MAKKSAAPQAPVDAAPAGTLPADFNKAQATKAVNALLAHASKVQKEREETELLERDEHVWLSINTKTGSTRKKLMPVKIQLPSPPLPPPPATSVCLITKDPQREYKGLLETHGIKFIARVVGVDKLKGKFKPFEPRRQLAADHELFLCDDRVLPMMPKLLGKTFFSAKKQPIPVNLLRKDLKAELGRAINSTYFHPSTGTSNSIRIATIGTSTAAQTTENLLAALPAAVELIPGGWENVLSVGIKTSTSVLLPVWAAPLDSRFTDAAEDVDMEDAPKPKKGKGKAAPTSAVAEVTKAAGKAKAAKVEAAVAAVAAPAAKAKKVVVKAKKGVSAGVEVTPKKKSSTIGSGAKKAKTAAIGKARK